MPPDVPDFLDRLSLDQSADARAIRRSYARELRLIDQAADLPGFQALREAYEMAMHWAEHQDGTAHATGVSAPQVSLSKPVFTITENVNPAPPVPTPAVDELDAPDTADAVFQRLMVRCYHLLSELEGAPLPKWEAAIRADLSDPALLSLIARHSYEQLIVNFLADGWRPGKEKLLAAAAEVFDWEHDHRRLPQFGQSGAVVHRAIDEREIFLRQPQADLDIDRKIIERLRSGKEPSPTQLTYDMPYMERMLGRFPHLMALSVDSDAVARWREVFVANGGVLKEIEVAGVTHLVPETSFGFGPWGLGIMLLVFLLRACGTH